MRSWKFWEKDEERAEPAPAVPEIARRFSAKPRTDLIDSRTVTDPASAEALSRLVKRRDAILFDVERSKLAASPGNPWLERAALIDDAIAAIRSERETIATETGQPGAIVAPIPMTDLTVLEGPPPSVRFTFGSETFEYREDLDWAERGFQLARSDLQLERGDPSAIVPLQLPESERITLATHLTGSLFVFASDMRDRVLAGEPLPESVTLADLARPAPAGGWLDWSGASPIEREKQVRIQELVIEEQRLLTERANELSEMAKLADRLPIARKRLADVDAEIAKLRG